MILESIFRGDFSLDQFSYPTSSEYKAVINEISMLSTKLKDNLSPVDYNSVNELLDKIHTAQYMESQSCFMAGLAVGFQLHNEITEELKNIL